MSKELAAICVLACAALASAEVDLNWYVGGTDAPAQWAVGDYLYVQLRAEASGGEVEDVCAIQAVITWSADKLEYVRYTQGHAVEWQYAGFPDDSGLDGLNTSLDDGDAYFHAMRPFFNTLYIWPDWPALVTTLVFRAKAPGEAFISVVPELGDYSVTAVLDATIPGWNIVGELDTEWITIEPECDPGFLPEMPRE